MPMTGLKDDVMPEVYDALLDAELRSVLDTVPVGVLLLSPTGRIRFTNAMFAQLFGLELQSLGEIEDYESLAGILESRFRDVKAFSYRRRAHLAGFMDSSCDE